MRKEKEPACSIQIGYDYNGFISNSSYCTIAGLYSMKDEFDRDKVDRIIVESNEKMKEIIQWMHDNSEWLSTEEMKSIHQTFSKGYIEFQGELIGLGFDAENNTVKFYVYMDGHYIFRFSLSGARDWRNVQPIFPPGIEKEKRKRLMAVLEHDNTIFKLLMKYDAIMVYASLHRETIVCDSKRKSHGSSSISSANDNKILPLTPKRYVITHIDKEVPGHHAAPEYQVEVRPTVRHLKSGKLVQVKGFTKYKDKPKKESKPKTYKA